jgi:hypothetical protein
MLTRGIGITLLVLSIVAIGLTAANLYFFTNLKGSTLGRKNESTVNAYLSFNSILLLIAIVALALAVLLVIPESRWTRTLPTEPLDL